MLMVSEGFALTVSLYLDWLLDDNVPEKAKLDHVYEDNTSIPGYSLYLYTDYETEEPPEYEEYWKGLCTYVELRKNGDLISSSSCYGYNPVDIESEIHQVLLDLPKNKII